MATRGISVTSVPQPLTETLELRERYWSSVQNTGTIDAWVRYVEPGEEAPDRAGDVSRQVWQKIAPGATVDMMAGKGEWYCQLYTGAGADLDGFASLVAIPSEAPFRYS